MDNITIKSFNQLPEEARAIRIEVFVDEQGFNEEFDTVDYNSIHFVAFDQHGDPIGTCRIFNKDDKTVFYLGRLAVLKSFRGIKVGSKLVNACEKTARNLGASEIHLHSQYRAMEFYQKCGYTEYGEIEYEEGCPHIWMKKNIGE